MEFVLKGLAASLGKPPGDLVYVGQREAQPTRVRLIAFDADQCEEQWVESADACRPFLDRPGLVIWIDVLGLADQPLIARLGEILGIHSLVLEDVLNTGTRPRMEDRGDYIFMMLKMLYMRADISEEGLAHEQLSLLVGRNWVVSFQEIEGDCFDPVRDRIRVGSGRVRRAGSGYLAYVLIDNVVDNYFRVLEPLAEAVEDLQEQAMEQADPEFLRTTHALRREIIHVRTNLTPVREWLTTLERIDSPLFAENLRPYIRDVQEHAYHVLDVLDSLREMLVNVLDIHLNSANNRLSGAMRVLSVIATIFMPLSFMAGVYGMNFDYMPGLHSPHGFVTLLAVMLLLSILMLAYFRRKHWI